MRIFAKETFLFTIIYTKNQDYEEKVYLRRLWFYL